MRGNHGAPAVPVQPANERHKICKGFPDARARLAQTRPALRERLLDGAGETDLLRTMGEAGQRPGQRPARAEQRFQIAEALPGGNGFRGGGGRGHDSAEGGRSIPRMW